jgi:hypothetical protein
MNDWIQLQKISSEGHYAFPEVESSFTFPNYKEALFLKDGYPLTVRFPDGTEARLPISYEAKYEIDYIGHDVLPTTETIHVWSFNVDAHGIPTKVNIEDVFLIRQEIENLQKLKPMPDYRYISSLYLK